MHKLYQLALTFHALDECPTAESFDPRGFAKWAAARNMGGGGVWAALFILSVWNDRGDWKSFGIETERHGSAFYMHDALGTWDRHHRAAFAAWAAKPWWC